MTSTPPPSRDGYYGPWSMLRSVYGLAADSNVTWEYWCNHCGQHFDYDEETRLTNHTHEVPTPNHKIPSPNNYK